MSRTSTINHTKNDFITAFWKMYEKFPLEKISVSELCRVAGYNRTTFYVYYDNMFDLLDKAVEAMVQPLQQQLRQLVQEHKGGKSQQEDALEKIYLDFLETNAAHIEILLSHHHLNVLEEKVKELMTRAMELLYLAPGVSKNVFAYLIEYQISALFGVMARWFGQQDISDVELVRLLRTISRRGSSTMLENAFERNPSI